MAQPHEELIAELHAEYKDVPGATENHDIAGGDLPAVTTRDLSSDGKILASSQVNKITASSKDSSEDGKQLAFDVDYESAPTADGDEPNQQEKATLRRIGENLPASAWLVAVIELCERFTYYGCQGLFQNYVQRPLDGSGGGPGALGLGQQGATGLNTFFQFWCYVTPLLGAVVADQYLGKYKTIVVFASIYVVGILILFVTSLPGPLSHDSGLGGFVVAILIIGIGTGGIKTNVSPLIADQYQRHRMAVKTLPKTGERVIIDPAVTIQRIYMIFYASINIGALSLLATPYMERLVGFWSAYLLCFCVFIVGFVIIVLGRKFYVVRPPQGSIITDSFKAVGMMIVNRSMDGPKPSYRAEKGLSTNVPWDDHFINELQRALTACKVFCFYPIFWVAYGQFSSNFVSQAGQMNGHGVPNDLMQNFDPISIIIFVPILDRIIYPLLRKLRIPLLPMTRITLGFWTAALGMAYAAIVQHLIYSSGPCYASPLCPASEVNGEATGNNIHIAIQTPAYAFIGLAEIFINVTGLEYAYTKSPPRMKSFVQALYLLTNAFGSAIAEALVPVAVDPKLTWMYTGIAGASFLTGCLFWFLFHDLNAREEEMNDLDRDVEILHAGETPAKIRNGSVVRNGSVATGVDVSGTEKQRS